MIDECRACPHPSTGAWCTTCEKPTMDLLKERYGRMLTILQELKLGMKSEGNPVLSIPKCPVCPKDPYYSYCITECEWAKLFGVCKKTGGAMFPEYKQLVDGIDEAIAGFQFILTKLEREEI